jgi:hypothetical protein
VTVTPEQEAWIQESSIESGKVYTLLIQDFIPAAHGLLEKFVIERAITANLPNAYAVAAALVNYAAAVLRSAGMPDHHVPKALHNTIDIVMPADPATSPPKSARKRRRHRRGRKVPR